MTATPGNGFTKFASTQNAAALAAGGGIDIRLSRLISFRPIQLDYLPTHFSPFNIINAPGNINATKWQQNLRYTAGLSFPLWRSHSPAAARRLFLFGCSCRSAALARLTGQGFR